MHRLYANTVPLYIRDLSIRGFWYPWGLLEPILHGNQGMIVMGPSLVPLLIIHDYKPKYISTSDKYYGGQYMVSYGYGYEYRYSDIDLEIGI